MPSEARKKNARRAVDQLLWVAKYPQLMVRIFMDFSADFGSPNSAESLAGESMAASDWLQPKSLGQDRQPWGPAARQHTSCTFYWLARQNGFRAPKDREKLDKSRLCRYGWRGSAHRTQVKGLKSSPSGPTSTRSSRSMRPADLSLIHSPELTAPRSCRLQSRGSETLETGLRGSGHHPAPP